MALALALALALSPLHLLSILLTVVVTYYIVGAIVNYRKLRQFPGPALASFSRFWLFWKECRAILPEAQYAALQQYGQSRSPPTVVLACTS
jgi:hypothetical protein